MGLLDYDIELAKNKLAELASFAQDKASAVKNGLLDVYKNPQPYIDQVTKGVRNQFAMDQIDRQFALRDRLKAGDQAAIQEYRDLDKQVQNKMFEVATNWNPAAVGMTAWQRLLGKSIPEAPQAEALRIAQQNAAKPISEGGLGLRPDNTSMERAKALGYDTPFQHGSNDGGIMAFDLNKTQKSDAGYLGQAVYGGPLGMKAYTDGGVVYPLLARSKDMQKITPENWNVNSPYSEVADLFAKNWGNKNKASQGYTKAKLESGVTGIIDESSGKGLEQIAIYDPSQIRSRFAAFDPARRMEADILGRADSRLLGLIAGGGLLGAGMYKDQ